MNIPIFALQVIGILIWIGVMVPALLLVSNFFILILFLVDLLMAENADQYDSRAQAMEEVHFDWRCIVCCMVALSPFTWNNSTSLALNLFILIWTTPPGLNVTSAIPPFICSVGPGNQFMLLDPDVFFCTFFCCRQF